MRGECVRACLYVSCGACGVLVWYSYLNIYIALKWLARSAKTQARNRFERPPAAPEQSAVIYCITFYAMQIAQLKPEDCYVFAHENKTL